MTWCPGHPDFVIAPNDWGAAYADRYDPANGRPVITPCTKLIVHHSASNQPSAGGEAAFSRQIEAYGESRDGAACEYSYLLYPTGVLHGGFGDTRGCHASATDPSTGSAYNSSSIGICFIGYFHPPYDDQPTDAAIETFQAWLGWMLDTERLTDDVLQMAVSNGRPGWYGHRDVFSTACPGDSLYPLLPQLIRPGAQPHPPGPPGGDDMAYVIYESIDGAGNRWAWADFLGLEAGGLCESVVWIDGNYKAQIERSGASVEHKPRAPGDYRTFRLEGGLPQGDQQYSWSDRPGVDFRVVT
jgi:hypothetical protein